MRSFSQRIFVDPAISKRSFAFIRKGNWHRAGIIPAYLVIAAVLYSATLTMGMLAIARRLPRAVEGKNQAEAELRSMASRLRGVPKGSPAVMVNIITGQILGSVYWLFY